MHQVFFHIPVSVSGNKTKSLLPSPPKGFESTKDLYIRQIKLRPVTLWTVFYLSPKKRAVSVTGRSGLTAVICSTHI